MTDRSNDDNDKPMHVTINADDIPNITKKLRTIVGGRQTEIPGTERNVGEIERYAEDLRLADAACKEAKATKDDAADRLMYALDKAGLRSHKYFDADGVRHTITATSKTTVKIKRGGGSEAA